MWVWKYALSEHKYVISADTARGDAADYSTFQVIDTSESEVVAEYKGKIPPDQFAILLNEAGTRYNKALLCPENNTYGYAVIMKLQELAYSNLYFKNRRDKFAAMYGTDSMIYKIGFTTSGQTRNQILTKLEEVIRNRQIRVYSSRLYEELKTFVWKGTKAQAQKGNNDDLVMALAIGVWLYDTSIDYSKHAVDSNRAMLEGFAINKSKVETSARSPFEKYALNPFKPVILTTMPESGSQDSVYGDMSWLL